MSWVAMKTWCFTFNIMLHRCTLFNIYYHLSTIGALPAGDDISKMMTERESLIALSLVEGLGAVTIRRLVDSFGSAAAAVEAPLGALEAVPRVGRETARRIKRAAPAAVREEMERTEAAGFTLVTMADPSYPEALKEIYDPPPVLYVSGELRPEDRFSIAVVGARRCSHYGRIAAEALAADLARAGLTVVSGLARGIDSAAHRGALRAGGRTIAVLGSGLDRIYPPENARLATEISASGAVVSEFPPGTGPARGNFPFRNRVISGISLGVLVVEAAERSGSLITARMALDQGRPVFAVPGRIDSPASRGTNNLIAQGAAIVRSADDVFEEFPYLLGPQRDAPRKTLPDLSENERIVLAALSEEERPIDEITDSSGFSPSIVAATLLSLELKRLVVQLPGKLFRIINRRPS